MMDSRIIWDFEAGVLDDNSPGVRITASTASGEQLLVAVFTADDGDGFMTQMQRAFEEAKRIAAGEKPS
jgi:hypothetical protein